MRSDLRSRRIQIVTNLLFCSFEKHHILKILNNSRVCIQLLHVQVYSKCTALVQRGVKIQDIKSSTYVSYVYYTEGQMQSKRHLCRTRSGWPASDRPGCRRTHAACWIGRRTLPATSRRTSLGRECRSCSSRPCSRAGRHSRQACRRCPAWEWRKPSRSGSELCPPAGSSPVHSRRRTETCPPQIRVRWGMSTKKYDSEMNSMVSMKIMIMILR